MNSHLIIDAQGFLLASGGAGEGERFSDIDPLLARLRKEQPSRLTLFAAEELLFFCRTLLPATVEHLSRAVEYQLDLLVPFPRETFLYCFTARKKGGEREILLYAMRDEPVTTLLERLSGENIAIEGLYPLHQRYLGRNTPRGNWGLLLEESASCWLLRFHRNQLLDRVFCCARPSAADAEALAQGEVIRLDDAAACATPASRRFDLLPGSFRRPDYLKKGIKVLAALNVAALIILALLKGALLYKEQRALESQLAQLAPQVRKASTLLSEREKLAAEIQGFSEITAAQEILSLLGRLTAQLPQGSYLDLLRYERKENTLYLQGYTDDISRLSSGLSNLGDVKLKSTSRRHNQTYFMLEVVFR